MFILIYNYSIIISLFIVLADFSIFPFKLCKQQFIHTLLTINLMFRFWKLPFYAVINMLLIQGCITKLQCYKQAESVNILLLKNP